MSRKKTAEWEPFKTAPKDGTELTMVVGRHRRSVTTSGPCQRMDAISAAAYSRPEGVTITDYATMIRRELPLVSVLSLARKLRRASQAY